MIGEFLRRLKFILRREQFERELDEEMRLHVELRSERLGDADAAKRQFGNTTLLREDSRQHWEFAFAEILLKDLRYALRSLRKQPTFAAGVIVTLALGLGLNAALFTIINAYVLRPLAVRDPYSLYQIGLRSKTRVEMGFTRQSLADLQVRTDVFSDVLAIRSRFVNLEGRIVSGAVVSVNYFSMLGGRVALGRPFQSYNVDAVLVLSDRAWRNQFGSDSNIVGRLVTVGKHKFEVIGVAVPTFSGIEPMPEFWTPMEAWKHTEEPLETNLGIVGRLKEGVTVQQAQAALTAYAQQTTADRPADERANQVELRSRSSLVELPTRAYLAMLPLLVAFGLTMAIPCANVANMMLARGVARQREIGVRLSLGASRGRVVRQLLTEGLVLAVGAGLLGMGIARVAIDLGIRVMYATAPQAAHLMLNTLTPELPLDWRVFVYVLAVAAATTLAFALLPALQATRINVLFALRGEFRSMRASRLRDALVVTQVSVCLVLLVSAGVMVRAVERVSRIDVGDDSRGVFGLADYTPIRVPSVVAELEREPWVETVAHSSDDFGVRVEPEGANEAAPATYSFVSSSYFDTFRIPILQGRGFTRDEADSGAPLAIVGQATAKRLWPGGQPIGKTLRILGNEGRRRPRNARIAPQVEVIGVARDVISGNVMKGVDQVRLYLPARITDSTQVYVRGKGDGNRTAREFAEAWKRMAAPNEVAAVYSVEQRRYWETYPARAFSWVASLLGGIALILTVSGIYGVISFLVNQRIKEIGIRIALGATPWSVVRHVLARSGRLVGVGAIVGLLLAAAVSKLLSSRALMVDALEPIAYLAGLGIVAAGTVLASMSPALRAARVDPAETLRAE
jgi:predicted permease